MTDTVKITAEAQKRIEALEEKVKVLDENHLEAVPTRCALHQRRISDLEDCWKEVKNWGRGLTVGMVLLIISQLFAWAWRLKISP